MVSQYYSILMDQLVQTCFKNWGHSTQCELTAILIASFRFSNISKVESSLTRPQSNSSQYVALQEIKILEISDWATWFAFESLLLN